jgi:hypothetical protein
MATHNRTLDILVVVPGRQVWLWDIILRPRHSPSKSLTATGASATAGGNATIR